MSFEKLQDDSKSLKQGIPFTQICNNVINNIKNGDAFLVWCYLYSKTSNWKTIKQNIKNIYGFSDRKLKNIFSYLHRANLIKYVQSNCANGKFAHVQIIILNGSIFDKNQQFKHHAPVGTKTAPAVNRTSANDELLNKDITKQRKEPNTKISCASSDARNTSFDEFWKAYPVKKNKMRTKKIWCKRIKPETIVLIMADISMRKEKDYQWKNTQFIPHPTTYLNGERWNDELILHKETKPKLDFKKLNEEIRSTVKEWAPGNPDYDRVHSINRP